MRKGFALSFGLFFILGCLPTKIGKVAFISISSPMRIVSPKNTPPYYAFLEIKLSERTKDESYASKIKTNVNLQAGLRSLFVKNEPTLVLSEMKIVGSQEKLIQFKNKIKKDFKNLAEDPTWVAELPAQQKAILENAKNKQDILNEKWSESVDDRTNVKHRIQGPIEFSGGLALTDKHRLEVRRMYEGYPRESGYVNPKTGEFHIEVSDGVGDISALLIDEEGKILGEGVYRLSEKYKGIRGVTSVPALIIEPTKRASGLVYSVKDEGRSKISARIANNKVSLLNDVIQLHPNKEGEFQEPHLNLFSTTLAKAKGDNHWSSSLIMTSGFPSKIPLFPTKMIAGMKSIFETHPQLKETKEIKSLIWGQVLHDGKPTAGIQVEIEDEPTAKTIYLNDLFFPDTQLSATSKNGYYMIVNASPGFHSLLASRSKSYFSHVNVVVENQTVAIGNFNSSMSSNSVPIRAFDAFDAHPIQAKVEIQSLPEELIINGNGVVSLPNISREGLLYAEPQADKKSYLSAQYLYNDYRGYIHIPILPESWYNSIVSAFKINTHLESGVIVGFTQEEPIEIFLEENLEQSLGEDIESEKPIYYFDSTGKIIDPKQDSEALVRGFIIFGLEQGTHEVIGLNKKTGTLFSKLIPVTPSKVSVLNF